MPTRLDPTRTTLLRRRFMSDTRQRFNAIKKLTQMLVMDQDVFGIAPPEKFRPLKFNVEPKAFAFQTDAKKVQSFRDWLQEQVDREVLSVDSVTSEPWSQQYVHSAYRQGTTRAFVDARGIAAQEKLDFFEGTKEEFLRSAFNQPERISKLELLATRSFEQLKGVTAQMGQEMSRILADGLGRGAGPREIARELSRRISTLTRQRAMTIARTEIIHAHSEGQLDSFEDLGVDELGVLAEFSTAGDDRVCSRCATIEGELFTVQEARGLIPLHPNCRCAWVPASATQTKREKRRRERKLERATAEEPPPHPASRR